MTSKKKIALIVQRYGEEIIGGAEHHARLLAQQLSKRGHSVEVFTTTAKDYMKWDNYFPIGSSQDGEVTVNRFASKRKRNRISFGVANKIASGLQSTSLDLKGKFKKLWYRLQGPYCPSLVETLKARQSEFDGAVFFTYLYYPTVFGLPELKIPTVLIPTAHDETPFYFEQTGNIFSKATSVLANSEAERDLIIRVYPKTREKIRVGAMGLDHIESTDSSRDLKSRVAFLGRIGPAKNVDCLIDFFIARWEAGNRDYTLALAGKCDDGFRVPDHPAVDYIGVVNDSQKRKFIAESTAIINPSHLESLSVIVLEALLFKKQVIVQKKSEVLAKYSENLDTVYGYASDEELENILRGEAIRDSENMASSLELSRNWVLENFNWEAVCNNVTAPFNSAGNPE